MTPDPSPKSETAATLRRLRHEMRTSLGQILGYSEMLMEDAEDRGEADMGVDLGKIHNSATRLLTLVDQILSPEAGRAPTKAAGEATEQAAGGDESQAGGVASGAVLVVDDTADNRDLLERRLTRAGYTVTTAPEGESALRLLAETGFDCVLLDVDMPGIDGYEVLKRIRVEHSVSDLPVIMATAQSGTEDMLHAFQLGANDYVTKPLVMPVVLARLKTHLGVKRTHEEVEALARELHIRNAFIRRTLGRYVSDEIATDLLENPESFEVAGEKRELSILLCDLRGFTSLTERLGPADVLRVLNNYLGAMAEVVHEHGGTIDEFIGDAVLAFFGAPKAGEDDARRALTCALAMQRAMEGVNERNVAADLPEVELGIGVATGDVIVGNIGSERRSKYGAIGSTVNLTARIESYTLGGEVLTCSATIEAAGADFVIADTRDVHPKGFELPVAIHRVVGLEGRDDLTLPDERADLTELESAVSVGVRMLEGKAVSDEVHPARIQALSARVARLHCDVHLAGMSNLRLELLGADEKPLPGAFYGKVVEENDPTGGTLHLRITARSEPLDALLRDLGAT
jgi:adenylate cyclase